MWQQELARIFDLGEGQDGSAWPCCKATYCHLMTGAQRMPVMDTVSQRVKEGVPSLCNIKDETLLQYTL